MAGAVTDGLAASGIPRCDGGAMAENRSLRRSVEGWRRAFREWMADPGTREASSRPSCSTTVAWPGRWTSSPRSTPRSARLPPAPVPASPRPAGARQAAPTGFFREFVVEAKGEHAGRLDVKHGGIMIIGNLARARAVAAGSTEKTTRGRLRAAADAGGFDDETRPTVSPRRSASCGRSASGIRPRRSVRASRRTTSSTRPRSAGSREAGCGPRSASSRTRRRSWTPTWA